MAALASIPEFLRERLANVVLKVEEFATPEQLQSVNIATRWGLSGLYEGRPLSKESVWESGDLPPVISLFRQPLLREWIDTGVGLKELIRHVVIHEAGHHFGFSDDDMHQLERMAED
ncbi:metallopeptidase family protein [Pontixanthobacter gangjinensis]|uniref:metallopeptidase family protein n=1 Tax=Pontixanthobacter gangjinensis TaxID=1028742 RepID=UPI002E261B95